MRTAVRFRNSSKQPLSGSLKPGEAQEVQFVLVGTEDPAELAAITWAAGDKGGAEDDRLEAILRTGDVGEVRERAKP